MHRKNLAVAIILATILIGITGCSATEKEVIATSAYDRYLILDMTETQYINTIKNDIEMVYAPKVDIGQSDLKNMLLKHMTDKCATKFSTPNTQSTVEATDVTFSMKRINFAYGMHQKDGIPRVIAQFKVATSHRFWDITLELKLNKDGLIYDYDVF